VTGGMGEVKGGKRGWGLLRDTGSGLAAMRRVGRRGAGVKEAPAGAARKEAIVFETNVRWNC